MTDAKPPRRSQESRSAETRARLLSAAINSLYRRGYGATTTMIVAEEAGVSRGAMLHQFPTKVELMLFVVRSVYREELDLYREKVFAIEDPHERVLALPEVMWEVLSRPEGVAVLEVLQGARSDPELAGQLKPLQARIERDSFAAVDFVTEQAGVHLPTVVKRLMVWSIRGLSLAELLAEEPGEMVKPVRVLRRLLSYALEKDLADPPTPPADEAARFRVKARVKTQD